MEITTKCQTKEGESTHLRNELRAIKQANDQQKMLKIKENEHLKNSWVQEKQDFQQQVQSLQIQLEMAVNDATTSKQNPNTVDMNILQNIDNDPEEMEVPDNIVFELKNELEIDPRIYENKIERGIYDISNSDKVLFDLLLKLQTKLAQLQGDYVFLGCVRNEFVDEVSWN